MKDFGKELVKLLGLEGKGVKEISIKATPGKRPEIRVRFAQKGDTLDAIIDSLAFFEITPKRFDKKAALTERRRAILLHSLGMGQRGQSHRNYFVTGPGSTDYADCMALVNGGYMERVEETQLSVGNDVFIATQAGKDAARETMTWVKTLAEQCTDEEMSALKINKNSDL